MANPLVELDEVYVLMQEEEIQSCIDQDTLALKPRNLSFMWAYPGKNEAMTVAKLAVCQNNVLIRILLRHAPVYLCQDDATKMMWLVPSDRYQTLAFTHNCYTIIKADADKWWTILVHQPTSGSFHYLSDCSSCSHVFSCELMRDEWHWGSTPVLKRTDDFVSPLNSMASNLNLTCVFVEASMFAVNWGNPSYCCTNQHVL